MNQTIKNFLFFTLFFSVITSSISAQDEPEVGWAEFEAEINNVFAAVDMTDVSSGLLLDRNMTFINIQDYNGDSQLKPTNLCDPTRFGYLYATLYGSNISSTNQLSAPDIAYSNNMHSLEETDVIPLGVLFYDYHKLKETAIDDNILQWQNGTLQPSSNISAGAFQKETVFAVTPLLNSFNSLDVSFSLDNSYYFSNRTDITNAEIDFGAGWQNINFGQTIDVSFNNFGQQEVKVKITLTDGSFLTSHFSVYLEGSLQQSFSALPDDIISIPATGEHSGGEIQIFYNCPDEGLILKPLIITDAFDPTDAEDFNSRFREKLTSIEVSSGLDLLSFINEGGYDLIYLDWNVGGDDLKRNAQLVKDAIDFVNNAKNAAGSEEPNILFGPSMGGAIAKIALLEMDRDGEKHDVEQLIALDPQFAGANLNLGTQAMIHHLVNLEIYGLPLKAFVASLGDVEDIMLLTATKQFLLYHRWESDLVSSEHSDFVDFLQNLDTAVPKSMRTFKYAIISNSSLNGNTVGARQSCFPKDKLFEIDMSINELLENSDDIQDLLASASADESFNPCSSPVVDSGASAGGFSGFWANIIEFIGFSYFGTRVKLKFEVWALPDEVINFRIYKGKISVRVLQIPIIFSNKEYRTPISTKPLDSMPGALFPVASEFLDCTSSNFNLEFIQVFHDDYCFIPAASSLDLIPPFHEDYLADLSDTDALISNGTTTADAIIGSLDASVETYGSFRENQDHANINSSNVQFLVDLIKEEDALNGLEILNDRFFNFGDGDEGTKIDNRISGSLEIRESGRLSINSTGKIGFQDIMENPENTLSSHYDVYIRGFCEDSDKEVFVHSGGELIVGDQENNQNTGTLHLDKGSVLRIGNGGVVTVMKNSNIKVYNGSKIIVEPGGMLIIREDGKVNIKGEEEIVLTSDSDSDGNLDTRILSKGEITIHEGAFISPLFTNSEIIVSGKISLLGGGFNTPSYEHTGKGSIVLNENYEGVFSGDALHLNGNSKEDVMLRLSNDATIDLPIGTDLVIKNAEIAYGANTQIQVESGQVETRFVNLSADEFEGATGLRIKEPTGVEIVATDVRGFSEGVAVSNITAGVRCSFRLSGFKANTYGILVKSSAENIRVNNCQFKENIGAAAYFEDTEKIVSFTESNIMGNVGDAKDVRIENIDSEGIVNNGIQLVNVLNLTYQSGRISGCNIGINGLVMGVGDELDQNSQNMNNIALVNSTTLSDNFIGIWTNGSVNVPTPLPTFNMDSGSVFMDCAALENNYIGIKGIDVLLQVDALDNCGGCEPMSENHRPNTFIKSYGTALYFDICLDARAGTYENDEIPVRGNFWSSLPWNGSLPNYLIREDCEMLNPTDLDLDFMPNIEERPRGCEPFGDDAPDYPDDDDCDMFVSNTGGDEEQSVAVHTKHFAGIHKLYQGDIVTARIEWNNSANVSEEARLASADKCRTKVDFARTYVPRSIEEPYQPFIQNENITNTISLSDLIVSPNPTTGKFTIRTNGGMYSTRIFDIFGKEIYTTNFTHSVEVDLSDLNTGIYFVKLQNSRTDVVETLRLVIE